MRLADRAPACFRSIGLPLEPALAAAVRRDRLGRRECVVRSCEPTSLRRMTDPGVPPWPALGATGGPFDLPSTTYRDMMTPAGPAGIARYADRIGPDTPSVAGPSLVADAQAAGPRIGPRTFRHLPRGPPVPAPGGRHGERTDRFRGRVRRVRAVLPLGGRRGGGRLP